MATRYFTTKPMVQLIRKIPTKTHNAINILANSFICMLLPAAVIIVHSCTPVPGTGIYIKIAA
jgi:hypothetical protein